MAWVIESTMGTISAIVAALEIHMERNIVTSMKPEHGKESGDQNNDHGFIDILLSMILL